MADKMWDILSFLKNPSGDNPGDKKNPIGTEARKRLINEQLEDAIENPEENRARTPADDILGDAAGAGEQDIYAKPQAVKNVNIFKRPEERAPGADTKEPVEDGHAEIPQNSPALRAPVEGSGRLLDVAVASIKPNPYQPRKEMGENEINELAESIKEFGVLQPVLVKNLGDGYELIAGERRLRAATRAGLRTIPAVIVETEPLNQQIMALVENIQRKNLSAIEEAVSLQDILSKTNWSQSELSRRMGRSQASTANKLRLLKLDPSVQELIMSGRLGERQARSLLSLSNDEQKLLAQRAIDEDMSARALEPLVENWNTKPKATRARSARANDEPGGELLGDIAALVNRHRSRGTIAQWKVKQMNQSSLVIEISVDLMKTDEENQSAPDED